MESNSMENNLKDQLKTMRKDLADKSQRLGKNYAFKKYDPSTQDIYLIYVFLIIKIELISNFLLWQVFDSPCFKFKILNLNWTNIIQWCIIQLLKKI